MNIYIAKGKVYKVMALEQKTDKFKKQEFVIEKVTPSTRATYTDYVRFQCINEKTSLMEGLEKGDHVVIKFDITGRKFNGNSGEVFYTNLDVIDLEIVNKSQNAPIEIRAGGDNDYSDLIPGLEDNDSIDDDPGEDQKYNDLPF